MASEKELLGERVITRWNDTYARVMVRGIYDVSRRQPPPDGWALLADGATLHHAAAEMRATAQELLEAAAALMEDHTGDEGK